MLVGGKGELLGPQRWGGGGAPLPSTHAHVPLGPPTHPPTHAGYMQTRELPPFPPVTRWLSEFQEPGQSDDQALHAALAWAHEQPTDGGLRAWGRGGAREKQSSSLCQQRVTRGRPLDLDCPPPAPPSRPPRLVLRGSGKWDTTVHMPYSLTDVYGPNPNTGTGGYIYDGAFIEVSGDYADVRDPIADVASPAWRGEHVLVVSAQRVQLLHGRAMQRSFRARPAVAAACRLATARRCRSTRPCC